jgi:Holliday junction resolvasome RuvABC endonuclease subunit
MGWALVDDFCEVVDAGCFFVPGDDLVMRLFHIKEFLKGRYWGEGLVAGIEFPYVGKDPRSALHLAACWGAIATTLMDQLAVVVKPIYPKTAKKALTGNGNATKATVYSVAVLMGLKYEPKKGRYDVADAVAVAMATMRRYEQQDSLS